MNPYEFGFSVLYCMFLLKFVNTEMYSSTARIEAFLENEVATIKTLEQFVKNEQNRLNSMKKVINEYKSTIFKGIKIGLDNPVHTYLVLKNVSNQWHNIADFDKSASNETQIFENITKSRNEINVNIPNENDLQMSRVGILRLQEVYDLNPVDIALGNFKGVKETGETFDADDCYKCALLYIGDKAHYNALRWIMEAVKRLDREESKNLKIEIMKLYSYLLYKQDNVERAFNVTLELQNLAPTDKKILNDLKFYENRLTNRDVYAGILPNLKNIKPLWMNDSAGLVDQHYVSLCSGTAIMNKTMLSKLHCYYKRDLPFLQLAPLKVELVYVNPEVRLFRGVISDKEIAFLKWKTKNKLTRTMVGNIRSGGDVSLARTAQGALMNVSRKVSVIDKRLQQMTNLNTKGGEKIQVINYGVGGHYNFHYDFFNRKLRRNESEYPNDRIATLSTPRAGGATVFSKLNLTLFPTKNDAVFWYNLKKNGRPDFKTLHAGCPVISGNKWIANKWLHEKYQEFKRPCDLDNKV